LLLFGAVALLLLIACSNLVSLLLTRMASRWKELAVRAALGSSTARLVRQFLMENLLVAGLGGLAGLAAAYSMLRGLVAMIPFQLPASAPITLDSAVLPFTLAVAVGTALLFTLAPIAATSRMNLCEALKAAGRSVAAGAVRARTRSLLVVGEVALSA